MKRFHWLRFTGFLSELNVISFGETVEEAREKILKLIEEQKKDSEIRYAGVRENIEDIKLLLENDPVITEDNSPILFYSDAEDYDDVDSDDDMEDYDDMEDVFNDTFDYDEDEFDDEDCCSGDESHNCEQCSCNNSDSLFHENESDEDFFDPRH